MIKLFKKPESSFFMPFPTDLGLDFCIFLASSKESKNPIHIYRVRGGQRNKQTDKNQTFYQTTTLQAGPINQIDNDSF